ncbi:multiheme c-type cytochrome [Lutibacter sp.]|uniref:multiheme c-type cytochrome n=1 Tax=Lutibacter sp. TaxID=1925666 RepID=UPI001A22BF3E|nr:multiheme c-type cytochrome [Lutibacter sp.]MBI9041759.1 hypothetical protein [Lutibacter sp.]
MKNLKLIGFLMILASSLMFIQCTSDPIMGPQGLAGVDGVNGVDGTDGTNGVDGTASCVACHNNLNKEHAEESYLVSIHAKETLHTDRGTGDIITTSAYTNRSGCVQCHTSGGYIDSMNGVELKGGSGYPSGLAYSGNQAITCTTCHGTHSTFDFANDGFDYALRAGIMPVALDQDPAYAMDMGSSNTCVKCHQPRGLPPTVGDASGNVKLNGRFGPHHGPQSTLLEGIQGAMYAGSAVYPAPKSATHRTGSSCTSCHMGQQDEGEHNGLHSWHPSEKACLTCHTNGAPSEVSGYAADMETLKTLLIAKGAFDGTADAFTSNSVPLKVAQAAWNFALLREDRSNGIHNPGYAKALLKNSIEAAQ